MPRGPKEKGDFLRRSVLRQWLVPDRLLNFVGLPLLAVYGFSVLVYPWLTPGASWTYVQAVWDRWQTLNAGALAFLASVVAFNIARYNSEEQRERDFFASKAFLPSTLSALMGYCAECARVLEALWQAEGQRRTPMPYVPPPDGYREVFSNCIRHASPEVGAYLVRILVLIQVHDARLRDATRIEPGGNERVVDRHNLLAYVLRLGELYALLGGLFGFARSEESFKSKELTWDELQSAYRIMDLEIEDLYINDKMNLESFTIRWLERTKRNPPPSVG